jgi:hypothetical protein
MTGDSARPTLTPQHEGRPNNLDSWYRRRHHGLVARRDRLLDRMRANPKGDWRVAQFKTIADRWGVAHRQPGTSHVVLLPGKGPILSVPAQRPIKPVYVRRFVAMIAGQRENAEDGT